MKVNDLIGIIHNFAPVSLAYEWDNVGFLLGDANWEVKRILLALDVTESVVQKAKELGANLIISHHPLIFKPLKKITNPLYLELITSKIAVISAHTNFDVTQNGVNHKLAEIFKLQNLELLSAVNNAGEYQVSVYVPPAAVEEVKEAVFQVGAGRIGNYAFCLNTYPVKGQFQPLEGSLPAVGKINQLSIVEEEKLEFSVDGFNLNRVITAIKKAHPYETPVYSVYQEQRGSERFGLGLTGELPKPVGLLDFARLVKSSLHSPDVKLWLADKTADFQVKRIAVCGGSGGSLISNAVGRADVFLSGEFGYHNIMASRIPLVEAGHFHTEYPAMQIFFELLSGKELEVDIFPADEHEINTRLLYL